MESAFLRRHRLAFSYTQRFAGQLLWKAGAVELTEAADDVAVATVQQRGISYQATVRAFDGPGTASYACSCRPVGGSGRCEHVWATLQAIDELLVAMDAAAEVLGASAPPSRSRPRPHEPEPPDWRQRLRFVTLAPGGTASVPLPMLEYYVEASGHIGEDRLRIHVRERHRKKNGDLGAPRAGRLDAAVVERLPAVDRMLLRLMRQSETYRYSAYSWRHSGSVSLSAPWSVTIDEVPLVLPHLAASGRAFLAPVPAADEPRSALVIDVDRPFVFELLPDAPGKAKAKTRLVQGRLRRDDETLATGGTALEDTDYVLVDGRLVRTEFRGARRLAAELASRGPMEVAVGEVPELLAALAVVPGAQHFLAPVIGDLPVAPPVGVLMLSFAQRVDAPLRARLAFEYDGVLVEADSGGPLVAGTGRLCRRDPAGERALLDQVLAAGVVIALGDELACPRQAVPAVVAKLTPAGFRVLAEGKRLRSFLGGSGSVRSGIDWFEVSGEMKFDDHTASLPELLRRSLTPDGFVELDDGTYGLLPAAWLRQIEALRLLGGEFEGESVKVPNSRGLLLDAMLAARDDDAFAVDERFAELRRRFASFTKVEARSAPAAFRGELRPYQREGLGWLSFLQEFGLGGCLADDMGLGKTVQVLALLVAVRDAATGRNGAVGARRRKKAPTPRPSVLVAPRSVLGNWRAECERFAPDLRVLDFSSADRWRDGAVERLADCDLVLTTYGIVRADAPQFAERGIRFHYAILDEAQAIKNPDSQSSKAVRLLAADHRLVLTGTPVENHLGDLWSLFEFCNPGMLGRLPAFRALFGKGASGEAMAQHRSVVQSALRPVLLRRTKAQVLTDLPAKVEQTLWCEMEPEQRKRYDHLCRHYRKKLLAGGGELGSDERFLVLEALLRLRQAACHEGLLDARRKDADSAKLAELLPRLEELAAEGHKALVFSQFTSFLDLVEPQLRERGIVFERLDGQTRDRAARVQRFQEDSQCPVFLISLKAGGFGLNLTAASYVFVLDPWWNPAVEMQAIDRAHRIGQKRVVHAYRLVCRGTVEERVLDLQAHKKALVEAILGNERSLLQDMTRADLELLLA